MKQNSVGIRVQIRRTSTWTSRRIRIDSMVLGDGQGYGYFVLLNLTSRRRGTVFSLVRLQMRIAALGPPPLRGHWHAVEHTPSICERGTENRARVGTAAIGPTLALSRSGVCSFSIFSVGGASLSGWGWSHHFFKPNLSFCLSSCVRNLKGGNSRW